MQKTLQIKRVDRTKMYPLGVFFEEAGLRVSAVCEGTEEAGIVLYDRRHREGVRVPFPENCRIGEVCAMLLSGYRDKSMSYLFYRGEEVYQDPFCKQVENPYGYGMPRLDLPRCKAAGEAYDWGDDENICVPYEEMILYALHVQHGAIRSAQQVRRTVAKTFFSYFHCYTLIMKLTSTGGNYA